MIGEHFLSPVLFTTVQSKADTTKVKNSSSTGDFNTASLSTVMNTTETNLATLQAWQTRGAGRIATLVFCVDVAHLLGLVKTFRDFGVDARYVTGETHKAERAELLDAFKGGDFPVLMNCGVFTEGTDIPNIDCVLLARPTRSRNLLVQMIGRGMRLHPGKKDCHVIDMVASVESGIVTTPSLFGLDPSEMVVALDTKQMRQYKDSSERARLRRDAESALARTSSMAEMASGTSLTFRDYESVHDLIDESAGERYIRAISPNAWVNVGQDRFILGNGSNGSYLTLEKTEEDKFTLKLTVRLVGSTRSPYGRPRTLINGVATLESAVRGADTYASKHFNRVFTVSHGPLARWREGPATDAQVAFLNKSRAATEQLQPGSIKKGKAGDMITKMKFGAKGRFKTIIQTKKREEKAAKKEHSFRRMREAAIVRVGLLSPTGEP